MLIKKKLKKRGKEEPPPIEISEDLDVKELTEEYKIKDFPYRSFTEEEEKSKEEILYPLLQENAPIEKILEEVFRELPPEVKEKIIEEKIEEVRLGGKETARKFFESLIEEEEGRKAVEKVIEKRKKSAKTAKDFFSFE